MTLTRRALAAAALALAAPLAITAALTTPASATPTATTDSPSLGSVYVLSNQATGNSVLAFTRRSDGTLAAPVSYASGGNGTGAGLGSQGAVILDGKRQYLYAVNAGSSSITSFKVRPKGGLQRVDTVSSGGVMPTSLTMHGSVLFVLNAGGTGGITGFTTHNGRLTPLAGSSRPLSSTAAAAAQVSFDPEGTALVVTEKATGILDVFTVAANGIPTAVTTVPSSGQTPFGFAFDAHQHVVVSEAFGGTANASAVSSYVLDHGTLGVVSASVPTTETAACWIAITPDSRFAYAGNAGTNSVTGYAIGAGGALTILNADGKTGEAAAGVTDLAIDASGRFLYGRTGDGTVSAWAIGADGSLAPLPPTAGLPTGAYGIAA